MDFYSYLWLRQDGSPYYAGKGCGRRAFQSHHGFLPPKDRSRILIFPMLSEVEAFESEVAMIELFGRLDNGTGCLHNQTDGGEGHAGHHRKHTAEEKARVSATLMGHVVTEETKAKLRGNKNFLGRKHTTSAKSKMRDWRLGTTATAETREKQRQKKLGNTNRLGKLHTNETKKILSEAARRQWAARKFANSLEG